MLDRPKVRSPRDSTPAAPLTRADWTDALVRRLQAVEPFRVESGSLLRLPGPQSFRGWRSDGMEGFARTFLGWSFLAASGTAVAVPGWRAEELIAGLLHGVRSSWPRPGDNPQTLVESALLVIALHETASTTWDRMAAEDRAAVLEWLRSVLVVTYRTSNWTWFAVLVRTFLDVHGDGAPAEGPSTPELLDRIESLHVGGGWYRDGTGRQFDWYNAWAFHFYPFLWARMDPAAAEPWLPRWRERLHDHLDDLSHLIGGNGSPVYQGRSSTYRFALLAPFWLGRLEQCSPLSAGQTRRLTRLVLEFFDDGRDALRVGWTRPFEPMRQIYTGAASPYWAVKAFVGLLLDPADAVWSAPEEALPVERGDFARLLPVPGWVVTGTAADGIVRVSNHGTDGADTDVPRPDMSSYGRLGYSSVTGPTYGTGGVRRTTPPDNTVVVRGPGGAVSSRTPFIATGMDRSAAASEATVHWSLPLTREQRRTDLRARLRARRTQLRTLSTASNHRGRGGELVVGPRVGTTSLIHGPWEVRIAHLLDCVTPSGDVPEQVEITGWAVPGSRIVAATGASPLRCGDAGGSGLWSFAAPMVGLDTVSAVRSVGANPISHRCVLPVLRGTWDVRGVVAGLIGLSADPQVVASATAPGGVAVLPRLVVSRTGTAIAAEVTWPDGTVTRSAGGAVGAERSAVPVGVPD